MGFDLLAGETPRAAQLLLVTPDGSVHRTGPEMLFANGMVLSDDGRTLWVVESGARQIDRLELSPEGQVIECTPLALDAKGATSRIGQSWQSVRTAASRRLQGPSSAVGRVLTPIVRLGQRIPAIQKLLLRILPLIMRQAPDGLAIAADGSLWYADMMRGAVVCVGPDGNPTLVMDVPKRHVSSCVIFETEGQEWLAITAADVLSFDGAPEEKTASLLAVPVAAVRAVAEKCSPRRRLV